MLRTAAQKGRLIVAVGSVVAAAAGIAILRGDLMVGYTFSKALEVQKPVPPFDQAATGGRLRHGAVGDEADWLSAAKFQTPVLASLGPNERLAVGDRIAISADGRVRHVANRRERHLEVVGVVGAPLIPAVTAPRMRLQVICRIVDPARPEGQPLVEFAVEVERPKPPAAPQPDDRLGRT
jgi:hypothetical protein